MRFRPCIDLHEGVVKQIVGASLRDGEAVTENFVSKLPAEHFAELYRKDDIPGGASIMDKKTKLLSLVLPIIVLDFCILKAM